MNPEISSTNRLLDRWARNAKLGRIADAIQPVLRTWLEGDGKRRIVKDLLHGTYIGHALHPMLTDVPIGAWTVTAVCDVLDACGARRYREAADVSLTVSIGGAFAAALAGWADWSDTKDEPQRLGLLHAALNATALGLYAASLVGRRGGRRGIGIATALGGYGVLVAASYLGGELSLGTQLGAKHTAVPIEPPVNFVRVRENVTPVTEDGVTPGSADGVPVLVSWRDGRVRAVGGVCTHRGAPLAGGTRAGDCIRCPWHGSRFSLADGRVKEGPATFGLPAFETSVACDSVWVRPQR